MTRPSQYLIPSCCSTRANMMTLRPSFLRREPHLKLNIRRCTNHYTQSVMMLSTVWLR